MLNHCNLIKQVLNYINSRGGNHEQIKIIIYKVKKIF